MQSVYKPHKNNEEIVATCKIRVSGTEYIELLEFKPRLQLKIFLENYKAWENMPPSLILG